MQNESFDRLSRALATATSRRQMFKILLGTAASGLFGPRAAAAQGAGSWPGLGALASVLRGSGAGLAATGGATALAGPCTDALVAQCTRPVVADLTGRVTACGAACRDPRSAACRQCLQPLTTPAATALDACLRAACAGGVSQSSAPIQAAGTPAGPASCSGAQLSTCLGVAWGTFQQDIDAAVVACVVSLNPASCAAGITAAARRYASDRAACEREFNCGSARCFTCVNDHCVDACLSSGKTCVPTAGPGGLCCASDGADCALGCPCPGGMVCRTGPGYAATGTCVCPPGESLCGTTCVNLGSDPHNCGLCGNDCTGGAGELPGVCCVGQCCPAGLLCLSGQCQSGGGCQQGETQCLGPNNESACCKAEECCQNGTCLPYDQQSAGACGTGGGACAACPANETCVNGACVCSAPNTLCGANCCTPGQSCQNGTCGCVPDHGTGCTQPSDCCSYTFHGACCDSGTCVAGNESCSHGVCINGTCTCIQDGQGTCNQSSDCCTSGATCCGGVCCPANGCCENGTCVFSQNFCSDGSVCLNGSCGGCNPNPGDLCRGNISCCSDVCCSGQCCAGGYVCQNNSCCIADNATCDAAVGGCCSGNCCGSVCCPSSLPACCGSASGLVCCA